MQFHEVSFGLFVSLSPMSHLGVVLRCDKHGIKVFGSSVLGYLKASLNKVLFMGAKRVIY